MTKITQALQKSLEEFDEKFGDREGCQSFGSECGTKVEPSGNFLCNVCEKWGGQEGIIKDFKRPTGSLKQIKSHLLKSQQDILRAVVAEIEETRKRFRCAACDGAKCGHTLLCNAFLDLQELLTNPSKEIK